MKLCYSTAAFLTFSFVYSMCYVNIRKLMILDFAKPIHSLRFIRTFVLFLAATNTMSVSTTSFSGTKLENPLLLPCSSSSSSASSSATHLSVVGKNRGTFVQRGVIRCDASAPPDVMLNTDTPIPTNATTFSTLDRLKKTSAPNRYTKERSSIVVIGLSVHTAPVEMREKLAIPEAQWPRAIAELCSVNHIEEAAILSTCNRMEIYVIAMSQHRAVKEVMEWMSNTSSIPVSELRQHRFILHNKDATQHLFEVSAGLDSVVLGEGQILAQVKQVVKVGQGANGFGRHISSLFKHAIAVGKRVRTETNIAAGAVSVSLAAVELAFMKLPEVSRDNARMLIVGAGKMGKLVIKHLVAKGCTKMVVVNRTKKRVAEIREELKDVEIIYKPLSEMLTCAGEADVVFTSTSSETPLFLKDDVHNLPPASQDVGGHRLFFDISVPRNVGSCVSDIESVRVYNVDDIKEVVAANKEDRLRKAMEAREIIAEELEQFEAWRDSLETVPTIKKLRAYAERIRLGELEKCLGKMGDETEISKKTLRAVDDLSRGIVNKLLHGPMQHLRYDGSDSRTLSETLENMHALNRMFGLDTEISVLGQKIRAKMEQNQK